ncbi:MAG: hypothetical protein J6E42_02070 [Firmicutes bacterium]|nr:hypothetical protein [Bacillota bacterium]
MIEYKIEEQIGVIEENGSWRTELNRISWNGKPAKLDLRSWTKDRSRIGKGLTMTDDAAKKLRDLLNTL